ncbi:MAG: hypothetical protein ACFFB3_07925 [Candidatus Hodarchaeota archaeon]
MADRYGESMNLDDLLAEFIANHEIPIFGIANSKGFTKAQPGWHPKELMPKCESVIVFGRQYIKHPLQIDEKTHLANESWWKANRIVLEQIANWKGSLVSFFDSFGLGVASFGGFFLAIASTFSYRLVQVEAGVGVYGRTGVCINSSYGCYYHVDSLLTEAELTPTGQQYPDNFNPCKECSECAKACPVRAIDATKQPGVGYDRELCARFILRMKERHGIAAKICGRCFSICPWSMGRIS